jgi:membrane protease YdiL (CAAX protease family)
MTSHPPPSLETALEPPGAPPPGDRFAAALRGFGPVGILAMLVVIAVGGVLGPFRAVPLLAWAYRSRTPWRELGFVRPRSWIATLAVGVVFGSVFKLMMKIIVMPLLGADPINPAYHYLAGNSAALPGMLVAVIVGAGFGEETVFRGFLFERLGKLFGRSVGATTAIVLLTSILFSLMHYPEQGLTGSEQAAITGVAFGTIFAMTGRIWMVIFAHAAFDVTAVLMIYWNLETWAAHLVFK